MDMYQRVVKQKADTPIAENEIRITSMGRARNYITYAMTLLQEKGANEVVFKAMGRAINKSVTIVELIKRRIPDLHQSTSIGSTDITDTWEPLEEGLLPIETTRHVSMITITLSKVELNTSSVGYQCPIPIEMVKPLAEVDHEGQDVSPRGKGRRGRGRGRGRGGRGNGYVNAEHDDGGRGRGGRGNGYVNVEYDNGGRGRGGRGNGYVNNEHDDGGMEPERSYARGRNHSRGGRGGRGRGGYSGPQPYYEAQHDGGDQGYNAPPPQDHGYDGPPPQGRGGRGRGGGRGGFNRSNGPPIQAAA
ncbi:hypothetical protein V5N11_018616 [Cardamine amara subsp. amara]|uniref:DNA/RNA-binding protein Alba-like domain-containing protein n=1 Tax=Cardamine amara subsp. amara TaxID=228776 RepID=A0ABD1BJK1_CARAN